MILRALKEGNKDMKKHSFRTKQCATAGFFRRCERFYDQIDRDLAFSENRGASRVVSGRPERCKVSVRCNTAGFRVFIDLLGGGEARHA